MQGSVPDYDPVNDQNYNLGYETNYNWVDDNQVGNIWCKNNRVGN